MYVCIYIYIMTCCIIYIVIYGERSGGGLEGMVIYIYIYIMAYCIITIAIYGEKVWRGAGVAWCIKYSIEYIE